MPTAAHLVLLAMLAAPPAGRPPEGPLDRYDPKIYDVSIEVTLTPPLQLNMEDQLPFRLEDTPIVMPVIFMSTFHVVDSDSIRGQLWLDGIEDRTLPGRSRFDTGLPFQTQLAVFPVVQFNGHAIRWRLGYRAQAWSSRIDDDLAGSMTWPREWPSEVQDGLEPQMYIESDLPIFRETVDRISGGELRLVPPYYAAKDIVRHCVMNIRLNGDGLERRNLGMLHGMTVSGAAATVERGVGSPHDLVCVCIAMLRAAGIPARAVVGIEERQEARPGDNPLERRSVEIFSSWGEFYLHGAGWIPFDPKELRGRVHALDVRRPWPDFGMMKDLNERVPLAFHFIPPASVEVPEYPAVWGWSPRPKRPVYGVAQTIDLSITSRGRGIDDER
jgi:hypothetical protein